MSEGLLGAIRRMFGVEAEDPQEFDEWDCPHCGLCLSKMGLVNDKTGDEVSGGKFCQWCGWTPSLVGDEPDCTPEEAFERLHAHHSMTKRMLEDADR